MVSRVVNMYRVFARTLLNSYQYGTRRAHPSPLVHAPKAPEIIPGNEPIVPYRSSPGVSHFNGMHWEGEWSRSIGGWIEQSRWKSMDFISYDAQSSQDMMRISMILKQLGVPILWEKGINTGGLLRETNSTAGLYQQALQKYIFPTLTPEIAKIITQHSREAFVQEYIYICRSTEETPNGRQLYKIGRSKNVPDRMRKHKRCNLELIAQIPVRDSRLAEKLIHCRLKEISHVSHRLDKCPSCGTGHREMFSVAKGEEGAELVKCVVKECVVLDTVCFRGRNLF